jgi:cob(I)alamin adenosyltransferase
MTVFYTGRGDKGKSKIGSKNLPKDNALFQLLGELDELNCWLGLCKIIAGENRKLKRIAPVLQEVQQSLFIVQAETAAMVSSYKPKVIINADKIRAMEKVINDIDLELPSIRKFIIPGGSRLSAQIDLARAVARRVERTAIAFSKRKKLRPELMQFLNRVSSLLFALARLANYRLKIKEENPSYK